MAVPVEDGVEVGLFDRLDADLNGLLAWVDGPAGSVTDERLLAV